MDVTYGLHDMAGAVKKVRAVSSSMNFQQHLQTGVSMILLGIVVWVGASVVDLRQDMVRLKERDEYKTQLIENLRSDIKRDFDGRYRTEDAKRDFARIEAELSAIRGRLSTIEHSQSRPK